MSDLPDIYRQDNHSMERVMKACKTCGNEIPDSAEKCTVCDSFQNWRRHVNVSSTVLALLVALVSVVATAVPMFSELLDEDDSDVNVVFQLTETNEQGRHTYFFIAANTGSRPAGIGKVSFRIDLDSAGLESNGTQASTADGLVLLGAASVALLSGGSESQAPFLLPESSHQLTLGIDLSKSPLYASRRSEKTSLMHAGTNLEPAGEEVLGLLDAQRDSRGGAGTKCSVLLDVINYNSEVETQVIAVDCDGLLSDTARR